MIIIRNIESKFKLETKIYCILFISYFEPQMLPKNQFVAYYGILLFKIINCLHINHLYCVSSLFYASMCK